MIDHNDHNTVQEIVRQWLGFPEAFDNSDAAFYESFYEDFESFASGIDPRNPEASLQMQMPSDVMAYDRFKAGVTGDRIRRR